MEEGFNRPSDNLIWCMKDLETFGFSEYGITSVKRHQGQCLLPAPPDDTAVELWIMFRDVEEIKISNTKWIGRFL